jgi:hypothetical protein
MSFLRRLLSSLFGGYRNREHYRGGGFFSRGRGGGRGRHGR